MTEARHESPCIGWLHLSKIYRIGKFIESESTLVDTKGWELTGNECIVPSWGDENVLKLMPMVAQHCKYTQSHWIANFNMVDFTLHESYHSQKEACRYPLPHLILPSPWEWIQQLMLSRELKWLSWSPTAGKWHVTNAIQTSLTAMVLESICVCLLPLQRLWRFTLACFAALLIGFCLVGFLAPVSQPLLQLLPSTAVIFNEKASTLPCYFHPETP